MASFAAAGWPLGGADGGADADDTTGRCCWWLSPTANEDDGQRLGPLQDEGWIDAGNGAHVSGAVTEEAEEGTDAAEEGNARQCFSSKSGSGLGWLVGGSVTKPPPSVE